MPERIRDTVVESRIMPLGNLTEMTEERAKVGASVRWANEPMNLERLQRRVVEEFESDVTQAMYQDFAEAGLWAKERELIERWFEPGSSVLDLGCGTGRTTMPLVERGYRVLGLDLTPRMIESALRLAADRGLSIDYEIGDATDLRFDAESWDHVLFSNQGWTQIPGEARRLRALEEVFRVLRPGGRFVFTAHPRLWNRRWAPFWAWQWVRLRVLKPLGRVIPEVEFGDRLFEREAGRVHERPQYIHIPRVERVKEMVRATGFELLECKPGRSDTG